jgi:hypothetical protein
MLATYAGSLCIIVLLTRAGNVRFLAPRGRNHNVMRRNASHEPLPGNWVTISKGVIPSFIIFVDIFEANLPETFRNFDCHPWTVIDGRGCPGVDVLAPMSCDL